VERAGRILPMQVTPDAVTERDRFGNEFRKGLLGILATDRVIVPLAPGDVVGAAFRHTGDIITMMVDTLGQVVTGGDRSKSWAGRSRLPSFRASRQRLGRLP